MSKVPSASRRLGLGFAALLLTLGCLFFAFYTVRLLVVTHGLRVIRAGGNGTYIGAVAFPVLSFAFGWGAGRCLRALRAGTPAA